MRTLRVCLIFTCTFLLLCITSVGFAWPRYIEDRPHAFNPGNSLGYFIWHDRYGFHLRTAAFFSNRHFSGTIRTNGNFRQVDEAKAEGRDKLRISHNHRKIDFDLYTAKGTDGIDFRLTDADWVQFELYLDRRPVNVSRIFLGKHGKHPDANSFKIRNSPDDHRHRRGDGPT